MDFVDEKDIAFFQAGQQTGQLAGLFDHGPASVLDVGAHRIGDNVRQGRLPEARRPAQQNVLEHVPTFLGRFDEQLEPFAHFHLPGELAEHRRPQRDFESGIRLGRFHCSSSVAAALWAAPCAVTSFLTLRTAKRLQKAKA